jgi:hypothetical protein
LEDLAISIFTLKMEAAKVLQKSRNHNQEDHNLNLHLCENLESHIHRYLHIITEVIKTNALLTPTRKTDTGE